MQCTKITVILAYLRTVHKCVVGKLYSSTQNALDFKLMPALYHQNDMAKEAPERFGVGEKRKLSTVLKLARCTVCY